MDIVKPSRYWRLGVAGLGLLVWGGVLLLVLGPGVAKPPPLPVPNGYDDLVAAGRVVRGKVPVDRAAASEEELRAFVDSNGESLRLTRLGVGRECRVPMEYSQTHWDRAIERMGDVRQASRVLLAAGRLAELEGRSGEAIAAYLDCVRLGQAASRGGLLIDAMLGQACVGQGIHGLQGLRKDLDAAGCHELIRSLEALDRDRETMGTILARDYEWASRAGGLQVKIFFLTNRSTIKSMRQPSERSAEAAAKRNIARLWLLATDLAIRAYRLENGTAPNTLADLVPRYLAAVPGDPFGTGPLVYRPGSGGGLLYSIGPDGQDNGGQPLAGKGFTMEVKGDVLLDPQMIP